MATITEDYCSFELSKLLKEKGFDAETDMYYSPEGKLCCWMPNSLKSRLDNEGYETWWWKCVAPTIQTACKWLRVSHNLNVEVYRTACGYIGCIVAIPSGTDVKFLEDEGDDKASGQYTEPELAYEAAIKYCLEHLI